jgi:hypothetical protein
MLSGEVLVFCRRGTHSSSGICQRFSRTFVESHNCFHLAFNPSSSSTCVMFLCPGRRGEGDAVSELLLSFALLLSGGMTWLEKPQPPVVKIKIKLDQRIKGARFSARSSVAGGPSEIKRRVLLTEISTLFLFSWVKEKTRPSMIYELIHFREPENASGELDSRTTNIATLFAGFFNSVGPSLHN